MCGCQYDTRDQFTLFIDSTLLCRVGRNILHAHCTRLGSKLRRAHLPKKLFVFVCFAGEDFVPGFGFLWRWCHQPGGVLQIGEIRQAGVARLKSSLLCPHLFFSVRSTTRLRSILKKSEECKLWIRSSLLPLDAASGRRAVAPPTSRGSWI